MASHSHAWDQLTLVVAGSLQVEAAQGSWTGPPGQAVWVPRTVEHAERLLAGADLVTLFLHASLSDAAPGTCRILAASPLLRELVLYVAARGGLDGDEPEEARLARVLIDQIQRHEAAPLALARPGDPRALRLARLVEDAPGDRSSLAELSLRAGASRRTMERVFVAELGMSVGEWRQRLRLHHSLGLLAQHRPIAEIARACGYGGATAFILAFRRHFGVTPHQYRLR